MNTRIKFLRKNSGLTQEKFAERIGLKQNSIALIESGKRNISDQAILSICREFGVREEWLRTGNGEMYAPAPTNGLDLLAKEKKLTHGEYILIEKFVGLNPETRKRILDYIQEVSAALSADDIPADAPAIDCRESAESLHAELDRQLGIEKKEAADGSEASGSCGTKRKYGTAEGLPCEAKKRKKGEPSVWAALPFYSVYREVCYGV